MDLMGFTLAILATVGFAAVVPVAAASTKRIGSVATLLLLQGMGIPLFLILIPFAPEPPVDSHIFGILTIGILFTFVYLIFLKATKIGTVSVVGTINQLYLVVTTILGVILLQESFTLWKAIGLLCTLSGVFLLGFQLPKKRGDSVKFLAGIPYALLSAFGTGIYLFSLALTSRSDGWFLTALFIRVAITVTSFAILLLRHFNFSGLLNRAPWKLLLLAAACDVAAFSLYNYCIATYEASTVTIITASQAAIIALLSWKFLKEKITRQQLLGIGIVLLGLISLQIH